MSACDVCIGGGYVDGYAVCWNQVDVRTRKDHKCVECRDLIPKGTVCERVSGHFDGAWFADHTCAACADIRSMYSCGETPPAIGEMWEAWREGGFDDLRMAGECWDELSAPAKEKLLEKWRKWKGL